MNAVKVFEDEKRQLLGPRVRYTAIVRIEDVLRIA
jgi:hypothetical protein